MLGFFGKAVLPFYFRSGSDTKDAVAIGLVVVVSVAIVQVHSPSVSGVVGFSGRGPISSDTIQLPLSTV